MLNEDRIALMTKMAAYEASQGKRDITVSGFFRGDYISFGVLKSALCATIGFALVIAMYILYDIEGFLTDFYKMDVAAFVRDIAVKYAVVLVIYLLISYIVYAYRYSKAKKHMKKYLSELKELEEMYSWE
ncbi:MAG: hypothetical protein IKX95_04985 [Lachnospiraceae bacterium]|nr:hypothetical protein [Lachnospiraceae bacterium]MBR5766118.1 hypothetical protein [Lachnospiraceae bacterium]MBR6469794.1 hypothetical protein [Lachnospiraceae bacterium]MBR6486062.1 hypothetical protein [Lachnospiraceae bacterium]